MTASSSTSSLSKAESCLQNAEAAKAAGNTALQSSNLRGASFQYKKVYLYLAEYLPEGIARPSTLASSSHGSGDSGDNGLVKMLQQNRRPAAADSAASSSPPMASSLPPSFAGDVLRLYATTLNNLALVHLKLGRYREGVACATAILETPKLRAALDGASVGGGGGGGSAAGQMSGPTAPTSSTPAGKALLRRASCYVKLGEWPAAEADLKTLVDAHAAAGVAPDPACVQLTEAIQAGRKLDTAKEKKMMQRMFS